MSYEELVDGHFIIAGTPDEVADRFAHVQRELGIGHLLLEAQEYAWTIPRPCAPSS